MMGSAVHLINLKRHQIIPDAPKNLRLGIISTYNKNGEKFMTTTTDNKKYENALKSLEAKRKLSEARGYAAGASILANNNPKFIRWGKRAQFLVTAFFFILPNVLVLKYGLEWF